MLKESFRWFIDVLLLIISFIFVVGFVLSPIIMWFMSHDDFGRRISIGFGIFLYGIFIFSESKSEKLWIEDGYIKYYAEIDSYFKKYITHTGKAISKEINISDVTDIYLNHYSIQHKAGETLYYRLTVCSAEDSICYDGREDDGFKDVWRIFQEVYPGLSLNFKRRLINYILNGNTEDKKHYKFPVSMYDDCFKLRVIRNPYIFGSKDKYLSCSWNEIEAKLDDKNMNCMLCLDGYEYPIYNFGVKNRPLVGHRFDYYVLWEIINDVHREKVERLSELSYMKNDI